MMVEVSGDESTVSVAAAVTCSLGGRSVPIVVTADAVPHTDVTVTMTVKAFTTPEGEDPVDPSGGLTPDATVVTLSKDNMSGVLGFACAVDATGDTLVYALAGTDEAAFGLSSDECTVTT